MLPILRNTVTGIIGVDAAALEAADGMGMTSRQRLLQVELPLALPVILAGIRTAVVWTVGMATLIHPSGSRSLGSSTFGGCRTRNSAAVLVGCGAAALLAIALDLALGVLQASLAERRRGRALLALGGMAAVLLGCVVAPRLLELGRVTAALEPRAAIAAAERERAGMPSSGAPGSSRPPGSEPPSLGTIHVGAKTITSTVHPGALHRRAPRWRRLVRRAA